MFRLIAVDMDGTLLLPNRTISEYTIDVLTQARQKDIRIVLATGRPLPGVLPYIDQLGLRVSGQYAVCYNGAAVYSLTNKEIMLAASSTITGAECRILAEMAIKYGIHCHAFSTSRGLLADAPNPGTDIECSYNSIAASYIDFSTISNEEVFFKFMFCGSKKQLDDISSLLNVQRQKYTVVRSMYCFFEFLNKRASKWDALKQICNLSGINIRDTVAFGDADNDRHMIKNAGLGIAMGNAEPAIRDMAGYTTLSNTEDGVAHAVKCMLDGNFVPGKKITA